jgi:hypothetical protein
MAGTSSSGRMKFTYKGLDERPAARFGEMKVTFTSEDDPFRRAFDELGEAHLRYLQLEDIIKGASKLLGDCKPENISKELKKLKEKGTAALEARNKTLENEVTDLKIALALQRDEIREQKAKMEGLELIREVLGMPADVANKAHLFDEVVKVGGQVTAAKIVKVLVTFTWKMEETLTQIRQLVSGSAAGESSHQAMPPPKETLRREKPLEEIKTPVQTARPEEVAETS